MRSTDRIIVAFVVAWLLMPAIDARAESEPIDPLPAVITASTSTMTCVGLCSDFREEAYAWRAIALERGECTEDGPSIWVIAIGAIVAAIGAAIGYAAK